MDTWWASVGFCMGLAQLPCSAEGAQTPVPYMMDSRKECTTALQGNTGPSHLYRIFRHLSQLFNAFGGLLWLEIVNNGVLAGAQAQKLPCLACYRDRLPT